MKQETFTDIEYSYRKKKTKQEKGGHQNLMSARYISPQCGLNGVPRWRQNSKFPVCLTSKY